MSSPNVTVEGPKCAKDYKAIPTPSPLRGGCVEEDAVEEKNRGFIRRRKSKKLVWRNLILSSPWGSGVRKR